MFDSSLKYKIGIGLIPGIGPVNAKNLIAYVGSIEGVFKESKNKLVKIPSIGEFTANQIIQNKNVLETAEKEIEYIKKHKIETFFFLDNDYPELLKQVSDAPILFYSKGNINFNERKIISIVGTRNATSEGRENCEKLISDFSSSKHNPIIVSGLAYGVDICAHKSALKNNLETIAVLGHGLDRIYPAVHSSTAQEIVEQGSLITEFMSKSPFERQNFLRRNRIIAGIAHATVVVESAEKGGSLVTADIANSYNRDVFAFPGRISDKYSAGCNILIKTNKAVLIESIKDIEYLLGWEQISQKKQQRQLFVELNDEEKVIGKILINEKIASIDFICENSGFHQGKTATVLLNLEFKGIVRTMPGKRYELTGDIAGLV